MLIMSQPTPYSRQYSFAAYQVQNPTAPLPAQQIDIELNAVKSTLDQVLANIKLIQRDDGNVANNTIGLSQLDGALIGLGFGRPSTWLTATAYVINVAVFNGTALYACLVAHTSGVFATDLAAGKWSLIVDFSTIVTPVQTSATAAASSAAGAAGSATAANSSALAAAISQAAAAASATSASTTYNNVVSLTGGRSMFHSVTVGGGVNAITVTHNPARVARATGLTGIFTASGANTVTNPTFGYDGLTIATLTRFGGQPLVAGDIYGPGHEVEWEDNGTTIEILNPAQPPAGGYVPTGTVLEYYGTTAPVGFLFANAQAVSRTVYAALFGVVGTTYGVGDGSTTFNVPDKRGIIAVGADNMGGAAANKLQVTVSITTVNASTAATVASATGLCKGMIVIAAGVTAGTTISNIVGTGVTLSAAATASATVSGRFSMFSDAQVLGALGGEAAHQLNIAELASHTHNGAIVANASGGGQGNMWEANGSQLNTGSTGSDVVHNNIQPSIICNFIIKT